MGTRFGGRRDVTHVIRTVLVRGTQIFTRPPKGREVGPVEFPTVESSLISAHKRRFPKAPAATNKHPIDRAAIEK